MAKTVTTRLDDESVNKIDEMAAKKGIDRSALLRLFLVNSLKEQTIQDSLESYKSGTVTLWEMIKEIQKADVHSNYDLNELKKDLKALNG